MTVQGDLQLQVFFFYKYLINVWIPHKVSHFFVTENT